MITLERVVRYYYRPIILGNKVLRSIFRRRGISQVVEELNAQGYKFTCYSCDMPFDTRECVYVSPENQEALDFIAAGKVLRRLKS